ncbi:hypothetical protein jhhlp_000057 [Lomentospora prolificans]|uniref:Beta-lactamase-related domain-containing protein n=1 Tax=Lomentospora prolificans TaxID=41688 RepID=A0A2N3NLF3_9PEZI|nr:hypothetical protein jhhlp_000057 [Lomentospora prolificans]
MSQSPMSKAAIVVPIGPKEAPSVLQPQPNGSSAPKGKGNPLNDKFKEFVNVSRERYNIPGIAVGVVHGDETYSSAYGYLKPGSEEEVTPDTLFNIGSMTKGICAATLLHVMETTAKSEKPITLDTKIQDIIPDDFVLSDEYATSHATLKDALAHRLGYSRHDFSYGGPGYTVEDAVRSLRHLPMTAEFREKFQYFNIGYMTIQHAIETITGKSCGDMYEEVVFKPLGMNSSTVDVKQAQAMSCPLATGAAYFNEAFETHPCRESQLVGQGGVISNVADMTKYIRAMINKELLLSKESQASLLTPLSIGNTMHTKHQSNELYAAGWMISSYRGKLLAHHTGGVPGYFGIAGFFPELQWGAVVMTNGDLPGMCASGALFYRLMDDYLEIPESDRIDQGAKLEGFITMKDQGYLKARETHLTQLSDPQKPHSLPLEEYAGTYTHPAYRDITFVVAEPEADLPVAEKTTKVLHALKEKSEWDVVFDLEHLSGEHFICYINTLVRSPMVHEACPAEFNVGPDGKVRRLGIQFSQFLSSSKETIWFDRIG